MEDPLRRAADDPDLRLIETMLWDGMRLIRLRRHLQRLETAASRLGWCAAGAGAALKAAVPEGPARMRLTLDGTGRLTVEATPCRRRSRSGGWGLPPSASPRAIRGCG